MVEMTGMRPGFRRDINGLRAWAVLAVIFYHFGIPGFGGGFVGVDVFFVISGFLMTGIVVKGLERNDFSLLDFYLARGRRIVPALAFLCAVLLVLGWLVLPQTDYKMLSSHSAYALSFLSNVEFWQEAGYFDVASHEKWLLHTWSLSVEWQYYLILPVVLWAVWRLKAGRAVQTWALGLGLVASLSTSVWVTDHHPSTAFFLLHTRAWEMLSGGLVFLLGGHVRLSARQRRHIESAGLLSIALAVIVFDKDTAWPGWRAVLPVAGAMLVLLAARTSRWTSSALPQWLGDRSYSLYLWHWPVVVALGYLELNDDTPAIGAALALTVLLGHLSYTWVEVTSRRFFEKKRAISAIGGLVVMALAVIVPALGVWKQQGIPGRLSPKIDIAASEGQNANPRIPECFRDSGSTSPSCIVGGHDWKVIAAGDSHVSVLISALAEAKGSGEAGVVWWSYSGCVFLPQIKISPFGSFAKRNADFQCPEFNNWAYRQLDSVSASVPIVIINRYALAAFGENYKNPNAAVPEVYFSRPYPATTSDFLKEFAGQVSDAACQLAKQRPVYLMRPIPEMGLDVPRVLSRRMSFGITDDIWVSMESYRKRNAWLLAAQDEARDKCGVKILDPLPYLCHDGRCYGSKNGRSLYRDDNHLSEFGNKFLVPMFAEVFKER